MSVEMEWGREWANWYAARRETNEINTRLIKIKERASAQGIHVVRPAEEDVQFIEKVAND